MINLCENAFRNHEWAFENSNNLSLLYYNVKKGTIICVQCTYTEIKIVNILNTYFDIFYSGNYSFHIKLQ